MASTETGGDAVAVAILNEVSSVQGAGMERDFFQDDVLGYTLPQQPVHEESQIFIRSCNRTVALTVNLQCDSVEDVKRAIEEREGIPVEEQHLVVCGKPLRQGAFLRDYDALGHQSTVDVSMRVRGGALTEMTLLDFVTSVTPTKPLIENITIPTKPGQQESMTVMSKLGRRILHGVLSCVLNAHGAGLVYDGVSQMDDFRVYVYQGTTEFARVVYARDAMLRTLPEGRFIIRQKEVYQTLAKVIEELFPFAQMPLHVQSIHILLDYKLAECMPAGPPQKRTQLLQAVAAMVSSSVGVATMWLNLKRFYDHLDSKKKPAFRQAITLAEIRTDKLAIQVDEQTLFKTVYDNNGKAKKANTNTSAAGSSSSRKKPRQDQAPKTPYAGDIGIFDFARNWFTHVPDERWTPPPVGSQGRFTGLPHLDHIFTHHFSNYMTEALLQLYIKLDDYDELTEVLVPLA